MNLQDFETQYREAMTETLNDLQTAVLLLAQVQNKISKIGNSVQHLSQRVEEFIVEEKVE
jgi:phage-related protein